MNLLYIIGIPGSGKSSLAAALVLGRRRRVHPLPFVHTVYEDGLVQLGRERAGRSGTDAMSMSVSPQVLAALETGEWPRVLGEGDRLAHPGFFRSAMAMGYVVDVVLLDTPEALAAERRAGRGSEQNATWVRGRITKVRKLAETYATITLDGSKPVAELAAALAGHPVLQA